MAINAISQAFQEPTEQVNVVDIDGAGGWLVSINKTEAMANIANTLQLDVIQVFGLRLGCLKHAF